MLFFKKKKENNYNLELLSLHIPKTAGTSFRNILKSVYGEDAVVRLDINNKFITRLNEELYEATEIPNARVLHGHYFFENIQKRFSIPEEVKIITWLRDPVKRVISNYYYLESRLVEILNEEQKNLNILSKMQRSLMEYARDEVNRNRQSKFLQGATPEDFDFIGIQENFDDDLIEIAKVLNWKSIPVSIHQNKTPTERPKLSLEILEEIKYLNSDDVAIYSEVVRSRGLNL